MKNLNLKKVAIVISVIFIVGSASAVMARGYGYHMGGYGNGYHMGMGYGGGHMMGGYSGGHMGYGYGHMMDGYNGGHMGYGYGHMMNGFGGGYHMGYGNGMWNQLSEKDRTALNESAKKFYDKTKDLREDLYTKNLELQKEFYKKDSSKAKVLKLHKEISALQAKLDKLGLEHRIDLQKKFPELYGRR